MTKQQQIEEYLKQPIKVGEQVYIKGLGSQNTESYFNSAEVIRIEDKGKTVVYKYGRGEDKTDVSNTKKVLYNIGANPINEDMCRKVENVNFYLESVLFKLGIIDGKSEYTTKKGFQIKNANFNPFVEIGGEKKFYQRPFVWTLEEMQSLIHSIYNRVSCGKIVIRQRGWNWLHARKSEGECYWYDVVDGKQRLTTMQKFLNNEFCDKFGNYYDDLSDNAQRKLLDHQLFSYAEMGETVTDEDVLKQFLSINFAGIPQSIEHINYVEKLLKINMKQYLNQYRTKEVNSLFGFFISGGELIFKFSVFSFSPKKLKIEERRYKTNTEIPKDIWYVTNHYQFYWEFNKVIKNKKL